MIGPAGYPSSDVDEDVRRPGDRLVLEVVTSSGRAAQVEFRVRMDTVEVWAREHCNAVLDRGLLWEWLSAPGQPLVVDEVAFSVDRMVDADGRIALSLPDLMAWTLSPHFLADLRDRTGTQA